MTEPQNEITTADDIKVVLKPILGIPPKYYLAVIYGIVLLGILFYFLLWDGLTRPGTLVTIHSQPEGASVHFNGKLYGHTPVTAFFPQGQGDLVLKKTSFGDLKLPYTSGNSLFLSGLLPRRDELHLTLPVPDKSSLEAQAVNRFGRWSAVNYTADYPAPPLFTQFVQDAAAQGWDQGKVKNFLGEQLRYAASPVLYADLGRAFGLWQTQPPESLETQYKLWSDVLNPELTANGRLIFWILINQPQGIRSNLLSNPTPFLKSQIDAWKAVGKTNVSMGKIPAAVSAVGYRFVGVPGGAFRWGFIQEETPLPLVAPFQLPVPVQVEDFWLSDAETTQAQYADFVKANPSWAPSNRASLISQGLADKNYLADWTSDLPPKPSAPVSGVSWYAAQAYADWLNTKLGSPARRVCLPSEVEWEWAAREAKADKVPVEGKPNALGLTAMQDGVWEWTASSWAPADQLVRTPSFQEPSLPSFFRTVKGGSSENEKEKVAVWDRGAVMASSSNPYLGFRVALKQVP